MEGWVIKKLEEEECKPALHNYYTSVRNSEG